eukprot:6633816-Prymnesium_polylepis.2
MRQRDETIGRETRADQMSGSDERIRRAHQTSGSDERSDERMDQTSGSQNAGDLGGWELSPMLRSPVGPTDRRCALQHVYREVAIAASDTR